MSRSLERKIRDEPAELGGLAALEVRYGVPGEFLTIFYSFLIFYMVYWTPDYYIIRRNVRKYRNWKKNEE